MLRDLHVNLSEGKLQGLRTLEELCMAFSAVLSRVRLRLLQVLAYMTAVGLENCGLLICLELKFCVLIGQM